ncbi:MAG TPA: hypothetical protein VJ875_25670 [Pyrinomonadaceae bacterium]|nr:hypothetical protein [Pyrinomonadaceae bacterium]
MIRRTIFSLVAGILFGASFLATPAVKATACQGYCADHIVKGGCVSDFAGCTMYYDANGNLEDVDCFYVNTCLSD